MNFYNYINERSKFFPRKEIINMEKHDKVVTNTAKVHQERLQKFTVRSFLVVFFFC